MEIADAARKHGVTDLDIEHAVRNAIRVISQGERDLYIGADRTGRLLEVVVLDDDGQLSRFTRWRFGLSSMSNSDGSPR